MCSVWAAGKDRCFVVDLLEDNNNHSCVLDDCGEKSASLAYGLNSQSKTYSHTIAHLFAAIFTCKWECKQWGSSELKAYLHKSDIALLQLNPKYDYLISRTEQVKAHYLRRILCDNVMNMFCKVHSAILTCLKRKHNLWGSVAVEWVPHILAVSRSIQSIP